MSGFSFVDEAGQPRLSAGQDLRIALDIRPAEPGMPVQGQAARCPGNQCGRIAFRNVGDDPWVDCVCGKQFNTNYSYIGTVPWPVPDSGVVEVHP